MIELPDFNPLKISQDARKPSKKLFDSFDHVAVVVPKAASAAVFRHLPKSTQVKRLFDREMKRNGSSVTVHLDNTRATSMTVAAPPRGDAFKTLTWARKLIEECLSHRPRKLGLAAFGIDGDERTKLLLALIAAADAAAFRLPSYKSKKSDDAPTLTGLRILGAEPRLDIDAIRAESLGNNIARWFTMLPPNKLTAGSYAEAVKRLAKAHGLTYEFIDEAKLEKLGAGAFLAVSQGNASRDAGLIRLKYRPSGRRQVELALVGKGILFDTGGNNLKPFKGMLDMHTDMQGSAVALGTALAMAARKVSFPFDVWLAVTENRVSATAYKSQDVVQAVNGKTIQVIHTDAEGRMVLADALALAARENPALIMDYATLTGACLAALTTRYSGVFSNRPQALSSLVETGVASGERVWGFPTDPDYDDSLSSEVADIKQCAADGYGDHILAARFLEKFVPDAIPWIHMDLSAGQHKGGLAHVPTEITGFGVRFTLNLLLERHDGPAEYAARLRA